MNIFSKIKRFFNLSLTDPKAWDRSLWNLGGSQSLSGEVVTEETALTYSAVYNAISLISGTAGSLPLHLMQKTGRNREIFDKIPLYNIMHNQWNPYVTAKAGRETMKAHALSWGNGYAEKVFNGYGEIVELWNISPDRVIAIEIRNGVLEYDIRVGNETKTLPRERILHIPGLGFDGLIGYSVIAMARKSIGLGMAMETFGSKVFSQGINPSAIIKHPNQVKDIKAMRQALTEVYAGLGNSQRLMLLEDGMDFEKIGIPPEDSQFLESRQFQITDIARWFNLPVHKLKEMSKSSFNNIYAENGSFVIDTMLPLLITDEQNYRMQLLTPVQQKQNLYWKHSVEGLLRANSKDRAEYLKIMVGNTLMTPNEGRAFEDMNPSDNPLADELFVMANMIPLSKFEDYLAKNAGRPPEKVSPPAPVEAPAIEEGAQDRKPLKLIAQKREP